MTRSLAEMVNWQKQWFSKWIFNGANLITLTRLPIVIVILTAIIVLSYKLDLFIKLSTPALFWVIFVAQGIGMLADGADGWYARKISSTGPTPEGQFLDQFIDKIFIWAVWWALSWHIYGLEWMSLCWYVPSAYLFFLDMRSCYKHWGNYQRDKNQPVNKDHGAVLQGKIKFCFENAVVCSNLLVFAPEISQPQGILEMAIVGMRELGGYLQPYSFILIIAAIVLARGSLTRRGVLKQRAKSDSMSFQLEDTKAD